MPKIAYISKKFQRPSMELIDQANFIIDEYNALGFSLTLRQLYYQLVARGILPNQQREYKRLGSIINDARLAGLVDWLAIVDRTRNLRANPHWNTPVEIMESAEKQYQIDKWRDQSYRIEVWIEKDALIGVISGICSKLDCSYFSCRGYVSASEVWQAARRFIRYIESRDQRVIVLHLADHDPSGIDTTRDLQDRIWLLSRYSDDRIHIDRIALTMQQIEQYNPPPNPAKVTDSRYENYAREYGHESWELDALEPQVLIDLVQKQILIYRDYEKWDAKVVIEAQHRAILRDATDRIASKI